MWGFEDLHLTAPLGAALEAIGWTPDDAVAREVVPTAARGHNLVVAAPPAALYAAPAVAGMCASLTAADRPAGLVGTVLCPTGTLEEWAAVVEPLAAAAGLRVHAARGLARATRLLRASPPDLLIATPETALTLSNRAAFKAEGLRSLLLAWPERLESEEPLAPIMGDLPKDAQRIIHTAESRRAAALVERYARKALTLGAPADDQAEPPKAGPVRAAIVAWERRERALPDLLEVLDPASCVVWTRNPANLPRLQRLFPASEAVRPVTGEPPAADLVVAFDLPTRDELQRFLGLGQVVLLVPPHAMAWVQSVAAVRPVRLPGAVEAAASVAAARRAAIAKAIDSRSLERGLLALAPLFERHDPAAVAAALYELWTESAAAPAPAVAPDVPATAKVWVGVGRKDGATPDDLVAVLTKEIRVERTKIGKVDVREMYSLVELPAQEVERVAGELNGTMIRRRRVTARVDRGLKPRPAQR
ncbi:MAG TPA: DbpA RNA binding domain-containing protein [Gemmatimonadales bacterium]|nr:DbpA RNA binding domain-containing protein [Gemmatimonadales bacterium]